MGHNIIVIGASAGGIDPLKTIMSMLPADLGAAVFVVVHTSPHFPCELPAILTDAGPLSAHFPEDGEEVRDNAIYVAPPDNHMLLKEKRIKVVRGPKENFTRPAIDPLFRSAALSYGPSAIGVILSGSLDDGTAGLIAIRERGGLAVVQYPDDAATPAMPRSAIEYAGFDHCAPAAEIGPLLAKLARESAPTGAFPVPKWLLAESKIAEARTMQDQDQLDEVGKPSPWTCPECAGVMYEIDIGDLLRFRCRVGHAYSTESMLAHQCVELEASLWAGARALEESALLAGRLADRVARRNGTEAAAQLRKTADDRRRQADQMRRFLETDALSAPGSPERLLPRGVAKRRRQSGA